MPGLTRWFRSFVVAIAVTTLLLLDACGEAGAARHSSAGVPVAHNSARGAWKRGQEWRLTRGATIGTAHGEGPTAFGSIVGLRLDDMGRVWIADAQQHQVHVFDADGQHVRTIGRKGAGPAEFAGISGIDFDRAGRLWVLDAGNARFAVYDTSGHLVETRPRDPTITTTPWPGRFDRQGRLYDVAARVTLDAEFTTTIVRTATTPAQADTFNMPAFEQAVFTKEGGDARNRTVTQVNVPFSAMQIWGIDPQGRVWLARTDAYKLERHRFEGGIDLVVEREYARIRIPAADRARMLENYHDFTRQGGKIDESRIPRTYPVFESFFFDDTGHLWVTPTRAPGSQPQIDVFDPRGKYLGAVAAPAAFVGPPVVKGDRMAAVIFGEDDTHSVMLLRIEKPAR